MNNYQAMRVYCGAPFSSEGICWIPEGRLNGNAVKVPLWTKATGINVQDQTRRGNPGESPFLWVRTMKGHVLELRAD